jgi:glucokinase
MILAGDIGGTKTNVGLFRATGELERQATYRSLDFAGLAAIIEDFLGDQPVTVACLGIAGPVLGNRARAPNLAWEVDGDAVARKIGIPVLRLINDLEATAEGILALEPEELRELNEGASADQGTVALLAPGTGLGMSIVARPAGGWLPLPSEGGHQSFAARNRDEAGLREYLAKRFGHVSIERVVSGPGLKNIYEYIQESGIALPDPEIARRIQHEDAAAVISTAGRENECPVCVKALEIFLSAFGAVSGNLALACLSTGGLYLGGGIAPKLWPEIADGTFLTGFLGKGRLKRVLEKIPVRLVMNQKTALLGAARRAARFPEAVP